MSLLLYIHCVTPEGGNWVLVLHLWMLDLTLWVARGQESLCSPLGLASPSSSRWASCLGVLGTTTHWSACLCGLNWMCLFQLSRDDFCGERDATFHHPCSNHFLETYHVPTLGEQILQTVEMSEPQPANSVPRWGYRKGPGVQSCCG